jgi:hypothetical protein
MDITNPCTTDSQCDSFPFTFNNAQKTIGGKCECGLNKDRASYCIPMAGDAQHKDYTSELVKWLTSPNILRCNTDRRYTDDCVQTWYEPIDFYYWYVAETYATDYPKLKNNDSCVQTIN